MRHVRILLLAGAALVARPAFAADTLKFGPAPAWVVPHTIPGKSTKAANAPAALLLTDHQAQLEPGKMTSFAEIAIKLQTPEGLSAGNIAFPWDPAFDTVTVNKIHIIRGGKVIDVLGSGQTFTIARRETNLDAATLDGTLTAALQPEDLQVGDIVDFAVTIEHSDPTLKNHVEGTFASWNALPIELAHVRINWPASMKVVTRESAAVPVGRQFTENGRDIFELTANAVEPPVPPKSAPVRYKIGRLGEVSDFQSWAELADLFRPLYQVAAVVPASGPLRDEVETIRKQAHTPKDRAQLALQLVENRVRYVWLAMGTGGLVPASAETTWSRRFGDCKAKTVLLLAILHELGIDADPVLVNHSLGDALADRLPMAGDFDHVIVRAHVGAKDYWLDGTRTGDTDLDAIEVPDFGWVLPLTANARLVHLVPTPLDLPSVEHIVDVDASAGVYASAPITIREIYRGDHAVAMNSVYSAMSSDQRDQVMHETANGYFDDFKIASSSANFDRAAREMTLEMKGTAPLSWKDGWSYVPTSSIAFDPDFDRPAGPLHDVPLAIDYPRFVRDKVTIKLPPGFAAGQKLSAPVHETLAGIEYARSEAVNGDTLTVNSSERAITPEVPYKDAVAAAPRLKALANDDIYLSSHTTYQPSEKDLATLAGSAAASAQDFITRGNLYLNAQKYDEAINDFTQALKLDPDNVWALADRGVAHMWKRQFDAGESDLAAAEARDPNNPVIPRARGVHAELTGDCTKAVQLFTQSLARAPNDAFSLGHRAACEAATSHSDEALADSAQALKTSPGWPSLRVLRANIFMRQGKRDLVAAEADAMIRENPGSDFAFVAAAKTYAALGQTDKAMDAIDHALAIKPSAMVYVNRAYVRPKSDVSGRLSDLNAALKLEPDNRDVLIAKASLIAGQGDSAGALKLLEQVQPVSANDVATLQRLSLLQKLGRTDDERKLLEQLRASAKSDIELNNICWAKATADIMLESALEDCQSALKLNPNNAAAYDSLGMVLLKLGRLPEALNAYNTAIGKGVGADSLMGRAFVYLKQGDRVHADADAAEARKASPTIDTVFAAYGLKFDAPPAHRADSGKAPTVVSVTRE